MRIKTHRLRELRKPVNQPLSTLGYREFVSDDDWKKNLISFTSLVYSPGIQRIICGLTSFENDLLYEFDPVREDFKSYCFNEFSEKFEIKIHRSLCLMSDGRIVGATACLHREDQRKEGKGGRIFILDPVSGDIEFLGIPVENDYIQTITLDEDRGLVYGFTYPVFNFFVFDLASKDVNRVDYMGSIPHIVTLDKDGCYWATWNCRTHNLFKYDPENDEIKYYQHSLPMAKESCSLMYPGAGPIDSMATGPDGCLYIGEAFGNLDRLDPATGKAENLGKPTEFTRMAAIEFGSDGLLYGIAGFMGECRLFTYDINGGVFQNLGKISDRETGVSLFIGHDLCMTEDKKIFVGETDTSDRAGYLWECEIT